MEYVKLNSISKILNGYNFKSNNYSNRGIRIIRITNVQDGFLEDNHPIFYVYTNELNKYMLAKNDILMSLTGNVGRVAIVTNEFLPAALNQRVVCIRCDQSKVEFKYLYYFFNNTFFKNYATKSSKGVAQLNMSTEWLKNITIPLRTKSNQIKIIEELDRITLLIEANNKKIHSLDNLVKSRFIEMFKDKGYELTQIKTVVDTKKISAKKVYNPDDEIKYIDISSIDNSNNVLTGFTPYVFSKAPSRAQQCLKENDILISTVRPNLRNIAIFNYDEENYVGSSGFCVLRSAECNPIYLKYIVLSDEFTEAMIKLTTGANYPAVRDEDVLNYEMINAPIELQNEFASFVELIDKSKFIVQKQIKLLEELLEKKMDEYFGN